MGRIISCCCFWNSLNLRWSGETFDRVWDLAKSFTSQTLILFPWSTYIPSFGWHKQVKTIIIVKILTKIICNRPYLPKWWHPVSIKIFIFSSEITEMSLFLFPSLILLISFFSFHFPTPFHSCPCPAFLSHFSRVQLSPPCCPPSFFTFCYISSVTSSTLLYPPSIPFLGAGE